MVKKCGNCKEFCEFENISYCQSSGAEVTKETDCVWGEEDKK